MIYNILCKNYPCRLTNGSSLKLLYSIVHCIFVLYTIRPENKIVPLFQDEDEHVQFYIFLTGIGLYINNYKSFAPCLYDIK